MGVKTLTTLARWVKTSNTQCPALSGSDISETWCWASLVVLLSESTCLFGWQLSVGKLGNLFLMVKKSYSRGEPAEILHEPNSVAICLPVWWIHSFAVQTVLSVPKNALIPLIAGFLWASFFSSKLRAVASPTIWAGWLALMWFVVTCNIAHMALPCFWFSESPVSTLSQASVSLAQEMCVNTMERHWEGQLLPTCPAGSLSLLEVWVCIFQVLLQQALWSPVLLCSPRRHTTRHSACSELLWTPASHQCDEVPWG